MWYCRSSKRRKVDTFNCLSNAKAQAANFPFCTIEPNVGVITVPDERLTKLAELVHPGRIVPTTVEIVDIAGLVKGASKGEGLGNKFLANIRETDAILHVLRCFDDENVTHVDGSVDPVRDKEIIDTELQLKDLETIESRIQKVQNRHRRAVTNKQNKCTTSLLNIKTHWNKANLRVPYNLTAKTNKNRKRTVLADQQTSDVRMQRGRSKCCYRQ